MRFEHLRGAAHKINKALTFDATMRLRRTLLDDASPDCRSGGGGGSGGGASGGGGGVEYQLVATVSHHGRNAAGARRGLGTGIDSV